MQEISRFKRSARAAACIFLSTLLFFHQPGAFGRFAGHVHKAFWCAVIELAVLTTIHTITYLSDLRPAPRMFQRLQDFVLNTLLSEAIWSNTVPWVVLFVAHGSLFRFPPATPTTLESECIGALLLGMAFLCIIQSMDDITAIIHHMCLDTGVLADRKPFFDEREDFVSAVLGRLIYAFLVGEGRLYAFPSRIFVSMALYLERIAVGVWVLNHVNAWNTLPSWQFCISAACSAVIYAILSKYSAPFAEENRTRIEAIAEEGVRRLRVKREVLAVDNKDLDEDAVRRLSKLLEILERIRRIRETVAAQADQKGTRTWRPWSPRRGGCPSAQTAQDTCGTNSNGG